MPIILALHLLIPSTIANPISPWKDPLKAWLHANASVAKSNKKQPHWHSYSSTPWRRHR